MAYTCKKQNHILKIRIPTVLASLGSVVQYVLQAFLTDAVGAGQQERISKQLQADWAGQLFFHTTTTVHTCRHITPRLHTTRQDSCSTHVQTHYTTVTHN